MRLGCEIKQDSLAYEAYREAMVYERHHRWEFNNDYRSRLRKKVYCFRSVPRQKFG